jgi:hypothetical protein
MFFLCSRTKLFFAGDRSQEAALKGLITEGYRVNESKGRDATMGLNRVHLMMASNNAFVVPASAESRRFAVFDVSNVHRQEQSYFKTVLDEMDPAGAAAGVAAMLYDLKRIPIDLTVLRKVPETAALHAQRLATLRGPAKWMLDVLSRGYLGNTPFQSWETSYSTDDLFDSYRFWSRDAKEGFPAIRPEFGRFLSGMFAHHRPRPPDGGQKRPPGSAWANLPTRAAYSQKRTALATLGQTTDWARAHHRKLTMLPTLSELVRVVRPVGVVSGHRALYYLTVSTAVTGLTVMTNGQGGQGGRGNK